MGYNLGFIAFDQPPSLTHVEGLTRFRLFKRENKAEWYLDGPNRGANVIPLFERPSVDERKLGKAWSDGAKEYSDLVAMTKRQGYGSHGLDYKLIPIALTLSSVLESRLLVASGNDEDLDCGFICSNGKLLSGRFIVAEEKAVAFDRENGCQVIPFDWSDGHFLYELMGGVAAQYFGTDDPLSYASGWQEIGQNDYQLLDQRS